MLPGGQSRPFGRRAHRRAAAQQHTAPNPFHKAHCRFV